MVGIRDGNVHELGFVNQRFLQPVEIRLIVLAVETPVVFDCREPAIQLILLDDLRLLEMLKEVAFELGARESYVNTAFFGVSLQSAVLHLHPIVVAYGPAFNLIRANLL